MSLESSHIPCDPSETINADKLIAHLFALNCSSYHYLRGKQMNGVNLVNYFGAILKINLW